MKNLRLFYNNDVFSIDMRLLCTDITARRNTNASKKYIKQIQVLFMKNADIVARGSDSTSLSDEITNTNIPSIYVIY